MPLSSILDGSGAFHLFVAGALAFIALILAAGITIGRALERRARNRSARKV